jgi:hypothetical protein
MSYVIDAWLLSAGFAALVVVAGLAARSLRRRWGARRTARFLHLPRPARGDRGVIQPRGTQPRPSVHTYAVNR